MLEDLLRYDLQAALVAGLQSLGLWLTAPMLALSFLGNEEFYLLVMPALYWCFSPALGLRAGLLLMVSNGLNAGLKWAFGMPRPYWYSPEVAGLTHEASFGLPSGHAQNAAALWGLLAVHSRRRVGQVALVALIGLIGLSRVYLGVHFITDVVLGWLVGGVLLAVLLRFEAPVVRWVRARPLGQQIVAAFLASLVLLAFGALGLALAHSNPPTAQVVQLALPHLLADESPLDPATAFTVAGAFFGLAVGAMVLQARGLTFGADGGARVLVLRYVVGVVGILVLWRGLGVLLPDDGSWLALTLRYLRYALIGVWISAGAPWLFLRLGWRGQPR